MTPKKWSLTEPQRRLLERLAVRPRFVRGNDYRMARRLREQGLVIICTYRAIGYEATITDEGRAVLEGDS